MTQFINISLKTFPSIHFYIPIFSYHCPFFSGKHTMETVSTCGQQTLFWKLSSSWKVTNFAFICGLLSSVLSALISSSLGFHAVLRLIMELFIFRWAIFYRCKEMMVLEPRNALIYFFTGSGPIRRHNYIKLQDFSAGFLNLFPPFKL